jgi:hypothetical protein
MLEYLPPRTTREVTIDGFAVPHIEARESEDGLDCHIMLDGRFGGIIPAVKAQEVLWLLANALAIGAGYSCHGENSCVPNPYKVRVSEIEFRA